ncbi:DUF5925 domain-containing protein [Streptomyces roseoverticillatus]|uniref:DUF5925 domain-containing protein n=1 Tax=Streptomyces roseoverticillatus TaxID=66429 RepID=UPI0033E28973
MNALDFAMGRAAARAAAARPFPAEPTTVEQPGPFRLVVNDCSSPSEVIDACFYSRFATGGQSYAHSHSMERLKAGVTLLPPGARVLSAARNGDSSVTLAESDDWTILVNRRDREATVTVIATSEELARAVLARAVAGTEEETQPGHVTMGFWHGAQCRGAVYPTRTTRQISAGTWQEVRHNYTEPVAGALDRLMQATPDSITGRLLLLHGQPGTGKTSALRTLAHAWQNWCQVDCVLDPEQLFHDVGYLTHVAIGEDEDDDSTRDRWRLLVMEDCDELIRGEAKHTSGQALSRLLNLTDGLLGQGRNVLVAVTTNEDLEQLHPAVVRPGRCLARIEVGPLTRAESIRWLGSEQRLGLDGATLAELFALQRGDGFRPVQARHHGSKAHAHVVSLRGDGRASRSP